MERALSLFRTGHFDDGVEKDKGKDFGDAKWGEEARAWVLKTTEITRSRWDCILEDAEAFVSSDDDGDDYAGDDGNEGTDPRTLVVLD